MKKRSKTFVFLTRSIYKDRYKLIKITYLLIKAYFFVTYMRAKRYYYKYSFGICKEDQDMQPYKREIRLIRRVKSFLPLKITCLMESMAIQEYIRQYNLLLPISLGVDNSKCLSAHAWISQTKSGNYKNIVI